MAFSKAVDQLDDPKDEDAICLAIMRRLLGVENMPFRLAVDHDVYKDKGTLKSGPCLLHYDWRTMGDFGERKVGITAFNQAFAERWILDALAFGYQVWRVQSKRSARRIHRRTSLDQICERANQPEKLLCRTTRKWRRRRRNPLLTTARSTW